MATYNKRGYKQKAEKVEKQVEEVVEAEELESTTAELFNALDETASKTEDFVAKNQKYIFIIIGVVAVVVLGIGREFSKLLRRYFLLKIKTIQKSNRIFRRFFW